MSTSSLVIGSDILGKHTIPELRNLVRFAISQNLSTFLKDMSCFPQQVGVLQDDCKNKKNELQLMVKINFFLLFFKNLGSVFGYD
jgi:hypothetical protein